MEHGTTASVITKTKDPGQRDRLTIGMAPVGIVDHPISAGQARQADEQTKGSKKKK
jgi:hypothetical protein